MSDFKTRDFWYDLPEELIAQTPLQKRDTSRLLTVDRRTGALAHKHFYDILDHLNPGDTLVMNDSRVRQEVVPTQTMRPPRWRVALRMSAVSWVIMQSSECI